MGTELKWRIAMLGILVATLLLYFPLNHPWGTVHLLRLSIDNRIPEIPIFVVPYVLFFFSMLIAGPLIFLNRPGPLFWRLTMSLLIAQITADIVYVLFQTTVPRPLTNPGGFFGHYLMAVRGADDPYSAFPSSHTFVTVILTWHLWDIARPWVRWLLVVNAILIIAATLFLRQHFVVDIIAGLALGVTVCLIARRIVWTTPVAGTPPVES